MLQLVYITMLLSSLCFTEEPKNNQKVIITKEQLKIIDQKRQEALTLAQKAVVQSQPEFIYDSYIKNEKVTPNLEPVKSRVYGSKMAKNKLVVFADFACGHCKVASKELKARVDENKKFVNLTYVFYPLDKACNSYVTGKLSDYSCFAAKLALCAEKQGKVWKAIDFLYNNQDMGGIEPLLSDTIIKKMESSLSVSKMDECIKSPWVDQRLKKESEVYRNMKIPGTPFILLNNRQLGGVFKMQKQFSDFIKYVDLKEDSQRK